MAQGAQRPLKSHRATSSNKTTNVDGQAQSQQQRGRAAQDDEATIAYIKRTLCQDSREAARTADSTTDVAGKSLEELLPPLTSSNAVDVELYAFIAVILSFAVQSWYQRITPDHQFVGEIVQIIAHCTRGLEGRLRNVDLESLILDELPDLLMEHVNAVRMSQTSRMRRLTIEEQRLRYHALRPHMAMEPVPSTIEAASLQQENEVAWCLLLVNRILPLLLPPEDLRNPCLHVLVSEILSELIFHNGLCGKASEPWLLWEGITKAVRPYSRVEATMIAQTSSGSPNRPELLDIQSSTRVGASSHLRSRGRLDTAARLFWIIIQSMITFWILLRSFSLALMQASSIPTRSSRPMKRSRGSSGIPSGSASRLTKAHNNVERRPIISMRVWGCMSQLLSLDRRVPWLTGMLSLLQWMTLWGPGQLCCTNSRLDRLMSFTIQERLLRAGWLPSVLRAARVAVFPDNALSPARRPPTTDEVAQIKRECAAAIVDTIPEIACTRFFATKDRDLMIEDVASELDVLADEYMNRNLIVSVVELIVVRLFPEMKAIDSKDVVEKLGIAKT